MAYQIAAMVVTLNITHWLQAFSNPMRRTFVQHFTRFQLTACSHGSSALAERLFTMAANCEKLLHVSSR